MTGTTAPLRRAVAALFGPIVWAVHFLIVYASESLFCRLLDGRSHTLLLVGATALALIAIAADLVLLQRSLRGEGLALFIAGVRATLDLLSALAIALIAAAGLAFPACAN